MEIQRDEKLRGSQRERLECLRMKKDDGIVKSANGLRVFERFRKRKRQLKMTIDGATCRLIEKGVGGASERQRVRMYGNPYQRHVDR